MPFVRFVELVYVHVRLVRNVLDQGILRDQGNITEDFEPNLSGEAIDQRRGRSDNVGDINAWSVASAWRRVNTWKGVGVRHCSVDERFLGNLVKKRAW